MLAEIERFVDWVQMRSPQARTWRDYKCDLAIFMNILEGRKPEEIRPQHMDDFVNLQVSKGYKPRTINRRLAAVTSFFTFLNREGKQLICPVLPKRHYLREPQRLPRPVNEPDLRKFFSSIHDPRDKAMFTLMLRCGLRIGEVAELKLRDLYLGEAPSRMIIHGKGARERTVYLSPEAERDLQTWLVKRPSTRCEHVFISYQQKKLSTTSINVRINRTCKTSGVDLTAHRLRHTFADQLLSAGMPITSIQKLMGHRFVETTQNYAMANDKQVEADFYSASEKLEGWTLLVQAVQPDGMEKEVQASTFIEAELDEISFREEIVVIPFEVPARSLSLPDALRSQLEAYCQLKVNRWRPERVKANSIHFYSQHLIMWDFFSGTCSVSQVQELRLEHVTQYVKHRLKEGYSSSTVNNHLSSLHSFLIYLKEDAIEIHSSLDNIQRLKEAERLPRYMTSEQVHRLRNEIEEYALNAKSALEKYDALLIRAVFYLLWQGGLRIGEVEGLRFSDFYISSSTHVKRLFIRDSKWRKGRTVYLTETCLQALKAYLAMRGMDKAGGYVFVRDGKPMKKDFLCKRLQHIGKQVDVSVVPHRLRHTFATQLLNVGCRVTSIQRLLGHTNLNTTMTYAHAFDETVMLDYFRAVDQIEVQPEGAWYGFAASNTVRDK
jgi:site-specific recombinase XerD